MTETHMIPERQVFKIGLEKVTRELFPGEEFKIAYSIESGVFCRLVGSILSVREVNQIELKLWEWIARDEPIEYLGHPNGYYHYRSGDLKINILYPAVTQSSMADNFRLVPFSEGFIIDFPRTVGGPIEDLILPQRLSEAYLKRQQWMRNIGVEYVSDVNAYISSNNIEELLSVSEALQEKEISVIADMILHERRSVRVLLISGPSSSGKTTFAQRLSTQLRVNGLRPVPLSLDNYFVDREHTPRDEKGDYDYESLQALDLQLLQEQILQLIDGETVETPVFDFKAGARTKETIPMKLESTELLLMEGIHALNPDLLPEVNRNHLFKIYLSALFELNIDLINRVPSTEVRLIRRMIRDDKYRGTPPEENIARWPDIRKSETKNIFGFAEEADVMFNSSLIYEMNAQRAEAEQSLHKIKDDSPYREERDRLLNVLSFFQPMETLKIPFNSIVREFIGKSIYFADNWK